jgi:hypothetical protein
MIKQLYTNPDTRYNWHKKFLICRIILANGGHYFVFCDYVWRRLVAVNTGFGYETEWQYSLTEVKTEWQEP